MALAPPSPPPPVRARTPWTALVIALSGALGVALAVWVSTPLGVALATVLPAAIALSRRRAYAPAPPPTAPPPPQGRPRQNTPSALAALTAPAGASPGTQPLPPTRPFSSPALQAARTSSTLIRPDWARISGVMRAADAVADEQDPTPLAVALTQASLRQVGLTLDRLDIAPPYLELARGAIQRAREALALLDRHTTPPRLDDLREPFALREELVAVARAVAYELGREVAVRFSGGFPARTLGDRATARAALTALMLEAARHLERLAPDPLTQRSQPPIELLVEATHEDVASQRALIRVIVDAQPEAPSLPAPPPLKTVPLHLAPLDALLRKAASQGGHELHASPLCGTPDGRRIGFELPVLRWKRVTGTTLFGVGALADRAVLVIEPRTLSRVSVCEALASLRLRPTAVTTTEDAAALLSERSESRPLGRFDLVVIGVSDGDAQSPIDAIAPHKALFAPLPLVTLESLDCLARPLPDSAAGLNITRLPRPAGPAELLTVVTGVLAPAPRSVPRPRPESGALTVLVAEDNPVNQAFIVKLLERRGVSVVLANNGADALDRLTETPDAFAAVLMDLQMPVMDGYEATAILRAREAQADLARTPVIAVTAHALDGERDRCLAADMDDYLSKPVDEAGLFAALSRVTRHNRGGALNTLGAPFDRARVLDFVAGDMGFLGDLITVFAETAPPLLETLREALTQRASEPLQQAAHQLKGALSNFGAHTAVALASRLETYAKSHIPEEALSELDALEAEVAAIRAGLAQLLTRPPAN